ncbi:hypothetical protein [Pantoea sp. A4]|uniref:hypothetical protein n=1 Tax=Pantoea sp. A4 TaxID=1225184 RepID=UPI00178CA19A|nr:hypothetical protein [Pantoea sp. A4]
MIIIHLRFDGGSTEEEHDIAHIASSIVARLARAFFVCCWGGVGARGMIMAISGVVLDRRNGFGSVLSGFQVLKKSEQQPELLLMPPQCV